MSNRFVNLTIKEAALENLSGWVFIAQQRPLKGPDLITGGCYCVVAKFNNFWFLSAEWVCRK